MIMSTLRNILIGFLGGVLISVVGMYQWHKGKLAEVELEASEKALSVQKQLQEENAAIEAKYKKEQESYEKTIRNLRNDIAAGRLQLSAKASRVTISESGETRCELDTETSQRLIDITTDGDKAIMDLNQCIDSYNKVKEIYGTSKN